MRRAGWWWALLVVLVAVVGFIGLILFALIVETVSGQGTEGVGPEIVAIAACVIVGGGFLLAARSVEHHVRQTHHGVGGRWGLPAGTMGNGLPTVRSSWIRRPSPRRHSPVANALALLIFVALAVGYTAATVVEYSDWRTSALIQHHGIPSTLTVSQVIEVDHSSRSGDYKTVDLEGLLSPPVKGQSQTTVHTPNDDVFFDGQAVPVLVDPHDPGRAELPGMPDHSRSGFIGFLVIGVIFDLCIVLALFGLLRRRRRRYAV